MRIEEDLKLGFKDVLIRPKRSTLKKPFRCRTGTSIHL
ncbi:GMP reductase [Salmonella enterica subsp. enterica serovar Heidelberg]|nr:GMP reductase [Salmonella enterica subsp. enterica] [Salmonella enterica subsp. enterica serovar Menston]SQJ32363.1 GMP reductase [Salmonella enterica subsp. enterica serovar Heidelberg]